MNEYKAVNVIDDDEKLNEDVIIKNALNNKYELVNIIEEHDDENYKTSNMNMISTHIKQSVTQKSEWDKAQGCFGKLKLCAKDVWGRKSVYLPLISHLSDTATDFASVVEFGIVAA
eukprot:430224_1